MSKRRKRRLPGAEERKVDRKGTARRKYLLAAAALVVALLGLMASQLWPSPSPNSPSIGQAKAALVDQISLTDPNRDFVLDALADLREAGFNVDYYPGSAVTVDFYRTLPSKDYKVIVLRTHSTNTTLGSESGEQSKQVGLFTSEEYSKYKRIPEQVQQQVAAAKPFYYEEGPFYFSVLARFIREEAEGQFDDTLIILGGCQSLATSDMAQAFVERGASAVIGWSELVGLGHNDQALRQLLEALMVDGRTVEEAVTRTMEEIGDDPAYDSELKYYPQGQGVWRVMTQVQP